jgi:hypothetical protein
MRFEHVFHEVPDVDAAVAWWRDLAPDAEVVSEDDRSVVLDVGGVRLALAVGGEPAVRLAWRVSPEALQRLADRYGAAIASGEHGARKVCLQAPGVVPVDVVAYPPDDDATE